METKTSNTTFPNKKLLKGRDQYQKLSPTNASGKSDQRLGILGVIIFSGILVWLIMAFPLIPQLILIYILIIQTIILFLTMTYYSSKDKITLDDALYFDPKSKAKFRLINLIKGVVFTSCFLFIFLFFLSGGGQNIIILVIGGIFIAFVYSAFIYEATKIYKLREQAKKFGPSKLTILKPSTIHLGDTVELQLYNIFLPKHLTHVNVMLKNIQEAWEWRYKQRISSGNNRKILRTYLLFEDVQKINVVGNTIIFNFNIPTSEVAPTNYSSTEPFYWELEISNEKENYHCIFYLEVKA